MHTAELDIHEIHQTTAKENVTRFKRYGQIIHTIKRGDEVAQIGKINEGSAYLVFYPDGEYDRFEDKPVVYRQGWSGPELPLLDPKHNKAILKSKSTIITKIDDQVVSVKQVAAAETKLPRAKKVTPKAKPEVLAWFGLLGAEPPKPRATKKPAAKKPASKKATAAAKH